ncbi:MAG: endopeptidase La [Ignavibacteria bacterium]|nr:endopeptidase La [Ignavibacteria bacterium]
MSKETKQQPALQEKQKEVEIVHKNQKNQQEEIPSIMPVLPLRDVVIFPHMIFPVLVGREQSLRAVSEALEKGKYVFLVAQKNSNVEDPTPNDIYHEGTIGKIFQYLKLPNGLMKILVDGVVQADIGKFTNSRDFLEAEVFLSTPLLEPSKDLDALLRTASNLFSEYVHHNRNIPPEVLAAFENIRDPRRKMYFIAANVSQTVETKQKLLQFATLNEQCFELVRILTTELDILKIEKDIDSKVHENIQKNQRKFFIQEQIRILQDELGDEESSPELTKIKKAIDDAQIPQYAKEKALEEFDKLRKTPPQSPESTVSRNFLDWIVAVPWHLQTEDNLNIKHVNEILDEDHFGLEKPKERILEYIAVLNLLNLQNKGAKTVAPKGQILCFVGPPGVGKTSLGRSIARALGRKFVRISLGGVRDEAEIRGHRRTYIGSMPGKIIQSMKKAGVTNPVLLMDEVDKMSMDFRGDPSSALLEVLDPEQNVSFNDHYLDVDYDLSKVMFITTANMRYNIPLPLQDRMEIIELPGYLEYDKREIAKRHILPKQLFEHGLTKTDVNITDEAITKIIREFTREAGVRNLERDIASLCRKVAKEIVVAKQELAKNGNGSDGTKEKKQSNKEIEEKIITVDGSSIEKYLGVPKFRKREKEKNKRVGSVFGLAWTDAGGDILSVDVTIMSGAERLTLTGQLGEVMKESAQAALSYIRSNTKKFGLKDNFYKKKEIHIHLPEGAIPKDGPSAGITMAMAIISAVANRPASPDIAMTGEITLRGQVLPIGGLNEKLLAAQRNRISTVLIPKDNEKDLVEIQDKVKEGLKIVPIERIEDALQFVFGKEKKKK